MATRAGLSLIEREADVVEEMPPELDAGFGERLSIDLWGQRHTLGKILVNIRLLRRRSPLAVRVFAA